MINLRNEAWEALNRAKLELASGEPTRARYGALELRLAMEAVTYDRAQSFSSEIPPDEYARWQPKKLMQVLHQIDPTIAMTSTVSSGTEDVFEISPPPNKMKLVGTDNVLTLADLKKTYDAIGSALHMPHLKQLMDGDVDQSEKIKSHCAKAIADLERVLSSSVWNASFINFSEIKCMRCENKIRKRMPHGKTEIDAQCFECRAQYKIVAYDNGQVQWFPKQRLIDCPTEGCQSKLMIWDDEIRFGKWWTCKSCSQAYGISYCLDKINPSDINQN